MFFLTTAIDYTNGSPHIGHAYEKVLADVLAHGEVLARRDLDEAVEVDVYLSRVLAGRYQQFVKPARTRHVAS